MKFCKIRTVDFIKQETIKQYRQDILISKRNDLKITSDDMAKYLGISHQAYSLIELNNNDGSAHLEKIASKLELNDEELKLISSYNGNLIDDAKKYALKDVVDYINETLTITNLYLNSHNHADDIRYASAVYLSLFFNVDYKFDEKLSKPTTKNSLAITELINNWLIENFNFLDTSFEISESPYFKQINNDSIKYLWDKAKRPCKIANTSNNYVEIASKIKNNFNDNKLSPNEKFKSLMSDFDVKENILNNLGISLSYIQKLSNGNKPITKEVINKMLLVINNLTPTTISILLGNYEQELISAVIEQEYNSIDIPADIRSICVGMDYYIKQLYEVSDYYNKYLYKGIVGNPVDYAKFQLFLSFYGITLNNASVIKVSNNDSSCYNINVKYKNQSYTITYKQLNDLFNNFVKFNVKLNNKYTKYIKRQNQNDYCNIQQLIDNI